MELAKENYRFHIHNYDIFHQLLGLVRESRFKLCYALRRRPHNLNTRSIPTLISFFFNWLQLYRAKDAMRTELQYGVQISFFGLNIQVRNLRQKNKCFDSFVRFKLINLTPSLFAMKYLKAICIVASNALSENQQIR